MKLIANLTALAALVMLAACGGGGGGDNGTTGGADAVPVAPPAAEVVNDPTFDLSGTWSMNTTERSSTCGGDGGGGDFTITVVHNVATGAVSGSYDGKKFTGQYAAGVLTFKTPFRYREDDDDGAEAWTIINQITVNVASATTLSGVSRWSWDRLADDTWDCSGIDDWSGTKN